jgi:endonuclease YncB( thermonuclease family)
MHCLIDDLDIGSMMVQTGMARDYSKYSGDYYQYEEDAAKEAGRGIWEEKY